eukprot:TRINITY_DN2725_c0_g1_i1.p1 TRINITY_DN2725_c0_g1~~TRINITY_DN2725_c0_g1_i1.p1  ORF type:complete len:236 (+),score=42.82 TRINITY_DN2725_c0_g1_i1:514-1221(+)
MAKVSASLSRIYSNKEMLDFSTSGEKVLYICQCLKNLADIGLFVLCCVEREHTWIYVTAYTAVASLVFVVFYAYLKRLGKFLHLEVTRASESVDCVTNERKDEFSKLQDMVKTVRGALITSLLLNWLPGVWYMRTQANFGSNPPTLPRNFYDYFGRFGSVWVGSLPVVTHRVVQKHLTVVAGKNCVDEVGMWFIDAMGCGKGASERPTASTAGVASELPVITSTVDSVPKESLNE